MYLGSSVVDIYVKFPRERTIMNTNLGTLRLCNKLILSYSKTSNGILKRALDAYQEVLRYIDGYMRFKHICETVKKKLKAIKFCIYFTMNGANLKFSGIRKWSFIQSPYKNTVQLLLMQCTSAVQLFWLSYDTRWCGARYCVGRIALYIFVKPRFGRSIVTQDHVFVTAWVNYYCKKEVSLVQIDNVSRKKFFSFIRQLR